SLDGDEVDDEHERLVRGEARVGWRFGAVAQLAGNGDLAATAFLHTDEAFGEPSAGDLGGRVGELQGLARRVGGHDLHVVHRTPAEDVDLDGSSVTRGDRVALAGGDVDDLQLGGRLGR